MSDKTVIETIKRDGLYEKYMKYKGKYLNLKDQIGGANFNLKDIVEFSKFGEYHTWEGTLSDTWAMVGKKSIAVISKPENNIQYYVASIKKFIDGKNRYDLIQHIDMNEIIIYFNVPEENLKKCTNPKGEIVHWIATTYMYDEKLARLLSDL